MVIVHSQNPAPRPQVHEPVLQDKPDARDIAPGKCAIEFRDVSFSYLADAPVIKDVSFACPGGKTLAFVGATGELLELHRYRKGPVSLADT